jgi:protein phosphatase
MWFASPDGRIFIVADGLGGHQAGEVAAREASDYFLSSFLEIFPNTAQEPLTESQIVEKLKACFRSTNKHVFMLAGGHELLRGMGTTMCVLSFHGSLVAISHVGDSRVYLCRDGILEQLTVDHRWTRGMLFRAVSEEQMAKGFLTRAIGTLADVEPTIRFVVSQPHDLFLLCTDGLSDLVSHEEIESALNRPLTLGERVRLLISQARQKGAADNVTVVLAEVVDGDA